MRVRPVVAAVSSFVLVVLAGCASTAQQAKPSESRARDFVPLAIGNRWEYRISAATAGSPNDVVEIVSKDAQGYYVDAGGRRLAPRTDGLYDGVRFLLQEPIEAGHEWIAVEKDRPDALERYKIAAIGVMAQVPAGTFYGCVQVELTQAIRHETTGAKATMTVTWIYAPGVGLVKNFGSLTPQGGAPVTTPTMELVAYNVKPHG